jgi:hypothetical protein
MANKKGKRVELGIWRWADGKGYIAEVNYSDPETGHRVREQKSIHRLDLAQEWRLTRKADALSGEVLRKKDQSMPVRFESFVAEYLEKWSKLKKKESTYTRARYSTERLKAVFGSRMLSEIRRRDIEDYVA